MNKFYCQFGLADGWWSGDIAPLSTVTTSCAGFKKSQSWSRVPSSRTSQGFRDNAAAIAGPKSIIIMDEMS